MKGLRAGDLDQLLTIRRKSETVDDATGYRSHTWAQLLQAYGQFLPGPGREYLASEALRAEVTGRFVIRYSAPAAAIKASDRVDWDGRVMEIKAPPLPDPTGRISLTLMVAEAGTDGA
jgi:SPP1 family predicted phage head-tail adaptor